jgi:hypothetical protein
MYVPSTEDFDAMVYSAPHPGTLQYMKQKFDSLSTNLTEMGQQFMAGVRETWERFNGSEAMRRMRAIKRKIGDAMFMRNEIQALTTLGQIQNAPQRMQNLIMSEPTIRTAFYKQRVDGFSATYVDPNPGCIGDFDYNYRRVMTGIVVDDNDGGWKARIYLDHDEIPEGEEPLKIDQQTDALITWDAVKAYLERGKEDPVSQTGGWL